LGGHGCACCELLSIFDIKEIYSNILAYNACWDWDFSENPAKKNQHYLSLWG
jgi:hypothetical protein